MKRHPHRSSYTVQVRGGLPADLHQRISELHALAILNRPHPPAASEPDAFEYTYDEVPDPSQPNA